MGYHVAYLIGAALVGIAIVVATTMLRPPAPAAHEEHEAHARLKPAFSESA